MNILLTRKFRSSRGSETRRKLDSVKFFVGLDFGLYIFQANLLLNMLVTLDSNLIHETLLKITFLGGVLDCNVFGESAAEYEYPANPKI